MALPPLLPGEQAHEPQPSPNPQRRRAVHLSRRQRHPRPPDGPLRPPNAADGLLRGPVSLFRDGFDPPLAGA